MTWSRRLTCAALGLCLLTAIRAQTPPAPLPALRAPQPGYTFPQKQTLNYSVDWRVFPAGITAFHLEADGDTERVTVTADSIGAVNLLYRVSDKFQSAFNRKTGCSANFNKQAIEGHRQVNTDLRFDYQQKKAVLDEKNLVKGTSKHQEVAIPECVTDSLSAIFYAASQPMQIGQSFEFPLGDASHSVSVTMKVEGKEEVRTPSGAYQAIRVEPTADSGVVKNRGQIWIWYTDDERHIPVQMRARLFWGTITFHLTSIEQK